MRSGTVHGIAARAAGGAACSALVAWATAAGAATSATSATGRTSSLSWVELPGAESCGGASILAKAVEDRLGRHALVSPAEAELSIEGHVERSGEPARWHSVIVVRDSSGLLLGSREFESAEVQCDDLRASVALAIALMIDPDAVRHPQPISPPAVAPPSPGQPATAVVAPPDPERPRDPRRAHARWRAQPSAAAALGFGILPSSLAAGVRLSIDVSPARFWAFQVYGGAWSPQTAGAGAASTTFNLAYGGAVLCPLRIENSWVAVFALCAGAEIGVMSTASAGLGDRATPIVDGVAQAELSFPLLGPLRAQLDARLGLGPTRRFFYSDASGDHPLFDRSFATAAWDVGLGVLLP